MWSTDEERTEQLCILHVHVHVHTSRVHGFGLENIFVWFYCHKEIHTCVAYLSKMCANFNMQCILMFVMYIQNASADYLTPAEKKKYDVPAYLLVVLKVVLNGKVNSTNFLEPAAMLICTNISLGYEKRVIKIKNIVNFNLLVVPFILQK